MSRTFQIQRGDGFWFWNYGDDKAGTDRWSDMVIELHIPEDGDEDDDPERMKTSLRPIAEYNFQNQTSDGRDVQIQKARKWGSGHQNPNLGSSRLKTGQKPMS